MYTDSADSLFSVRMDRNQWLKLLYFSVAVMRKFVGRCSGGNGNGKLQRFNVQLESS